MCNSTMVLQTNQFRKLLFQVCVLVDIFSISTIGVAIKMLQFVLFSIKTQLFYLVYVITTEREYLTNFYVNRKFSNIFIFTSDLQIG